MTKGSSFLYLVEVDFRCKRTLSAGMTSASSSSKLSCGVFSSCYSRWSRRLPLQSTIGSTCANQRIINGYNFFNVSIEKRLIFPPTLYQGLFRKPLLYLPSFTTECMCHLIVNASFSLLTIEIHLYPVELKVVRVCHVSILEEVLKAFPIQNVSM